MGKQLFEKIGVYKTQNINYLIGSIYNINIKILLTNEQPSVMKYYRKNKYYSNLLLHNVIYLYSTLLHDNSKLTLESFFKNNIIIDQKSNKSDYKITSNYFKNNNGIIYDHKIYVSSKLLHIKLFYTLQLINKYNKQKINNYYTNTDKLIEDTLQLNTNFTKYPNQLLLNIVQYDEFIKNTYKVYTPFTTPINKQQFSYYHTNGMQLTTKYDNEGQSINNNLLWYKK